ncbi:unnamed protein product [Rhizoctonia solani]|uniref:NADP-dependent oxidoreductase domain-containing protein n=1 Tax=Rhizoctonia solani TaxID=456999 RepID=A0A8H3BTH6_9AGAM|nr:unnamed protein product [Rhizoctonia solani]
MGQPGEAEACYEMVIKGLKVGYRHLDTGQPVLQAFGYGNEEAVGRAIRDSGLPREEIYVTTKLTFEDHGRVAEALDRSLKNLGLDYVDLYLMHWPQATDPKDKRTLAPEESPTNFKLFADSHEFKSLNESEGLSTAQLLISWALQRGTVPIPKSVQESRLKDNFNVTKLSDHAMNVIDNFHKTSGVHGTLVFKSEDGKAFGWTYDQLGWGMDKNGNVVES